MARKKKQRTMLGLPQSQLPAGPDAATMVDIALPPVAPEPGGGFSPVAAPPSSRPPPAQRSAGTPSAMGAPVSPAANAPFETAKTLPSAETAQSAPRKKMNRTMMGMPQHPGAMAAVPQPAAAPQAAPAAASPVAESPVAATQAEAPPPAKKKKAQNRTMLGMPAVPTRPDAAGPAPIPQPAPAVQTPPAAQSPGAAPEPQPAPPKAAPAAQTNRTMLGVAVKAPSGGGASPSAQTNRTMLGMKATPPADAGTGAQTNRTMLGQQAAPLPDVANYGPDAHIQEPVPTRRGNGAKYVAIFLLLGALVAGGVLGAMYFMRGPEIIASITSTGTGEALRLEVPGAESGTKLRFQGAELLLEGGSAQFPLGGDALQLGDNELNVDVVSPAGDVSATTLLLHVAYRVRPDLSALEGAEPKVRIVIDASSGSTVTLDEAAVTLDASGHGIVDFDLDASAGNTFERTFHYRIVKADGTTEEGNVNVSIPIAALQVARPAEGAVTDRDVIEIAGAVHEEATLQVNGTAVTPSEGRFVTSVALPEVGEHTIQIVARREGRAPRSLALQVRRVASLSAEARSFGADASLTYARIAAAGASYQGQKVAFIGRVFNAGESADGPMMQVVVRECPRAQRCPLWVTYDGAVPIEMNQWVRVYGTIDGEQQYRTADGEVGQSPRVRATIVIPEPTR